MRDLRGAAGLARALAMFRFRQLAAGQGEEAIKLSRYFRKRLLRSFRQELRSFTPFYASPKLVLFWFTVGRRVRGRDHRQV